MSLTSLVNKVEIKQRFKQEFSNFPPLSQKPIIITPKSTRYVLIGIAFDYLFRFFLESINPHAKTWDWVAKSALPYLDTSPIGWKKGAKEIVLKLSRTTQYIFPDTPFIKRALALWEYINNQYQ